jgi:hypothetical protein
MWLRQCDAAAEQYGPFFAASKSGDGEWSTSGFSILPGRTMTQVATPSLRQMSTQQPQLTRISFRLPFVYQAASLRRSVWLPPPQALGDHCAHDGRRRRPLTER